MQSISRIKRTERNRCKYHPYPLLDALFSIGLMIRKVFYFSILLFCACIEVSDRPKRYVKFTY